MSPADRYECTLSGGFNGARWHLGGALATACEGVPELLLSLALSCHPLKSLCCRRPEKRAPCTSPRVVTTAGIPSSHLKQRRLNHHTPFLTTQDSAQSTPPAKNGCPPQTPPPLPQTPACGHPGLGLHAWRVKGEIYGAVFLSLKRRAVHMYTFLSTKT